MDEKEQLCVAVDIFAGYMQRRLLSKYRQGWRGWEDGDVDDLCLLAIRNIINAMRDQKDENSLVDASNLVMMVYRQRGK